MEEAVAPIELSVQTRSLVLSVTVEPEKLLLHLQPAGLEVCVAKRKQELFADLCRAGLFADATCLVRVATNESERLQMKENSLTSEQDLDGAISRFAFITYLHGTSKITHS